MGLQRMTKCRMRSMVRRNGGRLFQMSGPQTANARRPNSVRVCRMTAALVDAERRDACLFSTIPAPTLFTANLIV